jgi:hypothetical protein
MNPKTNDSPDSPDSVAQKCGQVNRLDSPRPFYKKAGRVSHCRASGRVNRKKKTGRMDWIAEIPADLLLPDVETLERLSHEIL